MNMDKIYAESIAKEYAPKDNSKIIALFTYSFGIASSLVAGLGMCLAMQVIGGGGFLTVVGIVLGLLGFTCWGVNYPIYKKLLEKGNAKYAYEIVELAREISEQ